MWTALRVGSLIGFRQIQRSNIWTTALIIFIMMLTFLNLVGVSGILIGLIEGSVQANRQQYSGNVIFTTPSGDSFIENSNNILATIKNTPEVASFTPRFLGSASVEANYNTRRDPSALRDTVGSQVTGIDPLAEDNVTHLSKYVVEGQYLAPGDDNEVLLGSNLLQRFSADFGDSFATLDNIYPWNKS
jgi:ABC-type lipoprotein release transport system permease subunit